MSWKIVCLTHPESTRLVLRFNDQAVTELEELDNLWDECGLPNFLSGSLKLSCDCTRPYIEREESFILTLQRYVEVAELLRHALGHVLPVVHSVWCFSLQCASSMCVVPASAELEAARCGLFLQTSSMEHLSERDSKSQTSSLVEGYFHTTRLIEEIILFLWKGKLKGSFLTSVNNDSTFIVLVRMKRISYYRYLLSYWNAQCSVNWTHFRRYRARTALDLL